MPSHPKTLLVEGRTDQKVIPYLMEVNGVTWPEPPNSPVFIKPYGGVDEILRPGVMEAELRASGLEALGVVVDADEDLAGRWDRLKAWCSSEFEELPDQIPAEGLRVVHSDGPRFGIWIMPDNQLAGMLEDLLVGLIPDDSRELYELARRCTRESKRQGATYKTVHERKAQLHAWLAWQDPPGLRLHDAVKGPVLDPTRPESRPFVGWFRGLFGV